MAVEGQRKIEHRVVHLDMETQPFKCGAGEYVLSREANAWM
jgi:hypothetical protein